MGRELDEAAGSVRYSRTGVEAFYAHHTMVGLAVGDDVIHYREITK